MTTGLKALIVGGMFVSISVSAAARQAGQPSGIRLLSPETFAQAVADAERCSPVEEILSGLRTKEGQAYAERLRAQFEAKDGAAQTTALHGPKKPSIPEECFDLSTHTTQVAVGLAGNTFYNYQFTISSPYLRVMLDRSEAKRKLSEPKLTQAAANEGMVGVVVTPYKTFSMIEDMAIKRNEQIIKPLKKSITPKTLQNGFGAKFQSSEAVFVFPVEAFETSQSVELVVIAAETTAKTTMQPAQLSKLR